MKKKTKKRLRRWLLAIGVVLILSFLAYFFYNNIKDYYKSYYECEGVKIDSEKYTVFGIDVSSHQDEIDWEKVEEDGIEFAYIKATEGIDFVDKRYKTNYLKAKENGILVGAYHFFRFGTSGKEQAQNFINQVSIENLDLPPVLDVERHGNYLSFSKVDQIRIEIKNYLNEIEKNYFIKPIIYTNIEGYQDYIKGHFDDYEIWICRICSEPDNNHWTFWQYSHKGKVDGIDGKVDLNTFNGDIEDFIEYVNQYKELQR